MRNRCIAFIYWSSVLTGLYGATPLAQERLLQNSLPVRTAAISDEGPLQADTRLENLLLKLRTSPDKQASLDLLLLEQRDSSSPQFQHWLTPEEFGEKFGPSKEDVKKLAAWLESQGLSMDSVAHGGGWISFSGTAAQMENAFHTHLRCFGGGSGQKHFGNVTALSLPAEIAALVGAVEGMNNFPLDESPAKGISGHPLSPRDFNTVFNIEPLNREGFYGKGVTVVVSGQAQIRVEDLQVFRAGFHLPPNDPQVRLFGTEPETNEADRRQSEADLEWVGVAAPQSNIVYAYASSFLLALEKSIDENLGQVVSASHGVCEGLRSGSLRALGQQASAQGISWVTASASQYCVIEPASAPEVTAAYAMLNPHEASGLPALVLSASGFDGYQVFTGEWRAVPTAAAATPALAGIVGLLNEYSLAKGSQPTLGIGNMNRNLHQLAATTSDVFNHGSKQGSLDAYRLITRWAGTSQSVITSILLTAAQAMLHENELTSILATVAPAKGNSSPSGDVLFFQGGKPLGSSALIPQGAAAVALLEVSGDSLQPGRNKITATYPGTSGFDAAVGSMGLLLRRRQNDRIDQPAGSSPSIEVDIESLTVNLSPCMRITATVTHPAGARSVPGTVTFRQGGRSLGTEKLDLSVTGDVAMMTVREQAFEIGDSKIEATFQPLSGGFEESAEAEIVISAPER